MREMSFFDRLIISQPIPFINKIGNAIEDYFYLDGISSQLGHHCYSVITSGPFVKKDESKSHIRIALNIIKLLSYFTGVIPLALLIGKAIHRAGHHYKVLEQNPLPAHIPDEYILRVRQIRNDETHIPDINECRKNLFSRQTPAWQIIKALPETQGFIEKLKMDFENKSTDEKEQPMNFFKLDPLDFFIMDQLQQFILHDLDHGNFDQKRIFAKGKEIDAHGIEAQKGGIHNLLNIMLEGVIFSRWFGPLADNLPEFHAGPHGPYYIIIDSDKMIADKRGSPRAKKGMIDEKYHKAYLVPEDKHRQFLVSALTQAAQTGMLTQTEKEKIEAKIVIYDEF